MAVFSFDDIYVISFTDITRGSILIPVNSLVRDQIDITLIGKSRNEYGEILAENTVHLLENFASFEDLGALPSIIQPDLTQVTNPILRQPTLGQFWYNKTRKLLFYFNKFSKWTQLKLRTDIRVLSGVILHGQQIPLPATLSYDECSIMVSPQYIDQKCNYIECYNSADGIVNIKYKSISTGELIEGVANYIIIGIADTVNNFIPVTLTPTPSPPVNSPTPTPTPTPTSTPAPGVSVTPTPSNTRTPTPTSTASITPTPTVTRTQTRTVSVTPTASPINSLTVLMFTDTFVSGNPGVPDAFGYSSFIEIGNVSPLFFKNTFIAGIFTSRFIGSPTINLTFTFADPANTPPVNTLTKVQFTDKDGIFRVFLTSNAQITGQSSSGTNTLSYIFTVPSTLFNPGTSYLISLE